MPVLGGTPATEVPKPGALAGAMGAGCPSCLLTLPSPPPVALSLGRRGADGGVCAGGTVSAPLPKLLQTLTHTHTKTHT